MCQARFLAMPGGPRSAVTSSLAPLQEQSAAQDPPSSPPSQNRRRTSEEGHAVSGSQDSNLAPLAVLQLLISETQVTLQIPGRGRIVHRRSRIYSVAHNAGLRQGHLPGAVGAAAGGRGDCSTTSIGSCSMPGLCQYLETHESKVRSLQRSHANQSIDPRRQLPGHTLTATTSGGRWPQCE